MTQVKELNMYRQLYGEEGEPAGEIYATAILVRPTDTDADVLTKAHKQGQLLMIQNVNQLVIERDSENYPESIELITNTHTDETLMLYQLDED